MASWLLASEPICLAEPGSAQPAWPVALGRGPSLGQGLLQASACRELVLADGVDGDGVMEQRGKPPWSRGAGR